MKQISCSYYQLRSFDTIEEVQRWLNGFCEPINVINQTYLPIETSLGLSYTIIVTIERERKLGE